jgi:hypothetical protein
MASPASMLKRRHSRTHTLTNTHTRMLTHAYTHARTHRHSDVKKLLMGDFEITMDDESFRVLSHAH